MYPAESRRRAGLLGMVLLGPLLMAPTAAAAAPPPLAVDVALVGLGHALASAARLAPYMRPGDAWELVTNPVGPRFEVRYHRVLARLHRRYPRIRILVLTSGIHDLLLLAPMTPRYVEWLGDDFEPGYEPEFSWNLKVMALEFRVATRHLKVYHKRLFVAPVGRHLFQPTLGPRLWHRLSTDYSWVMPQTQHLAHRPRAFLSTVRAIRRGLPRRIRFWPEVTVGDPHRQRDVPNGMPPARLARVLHHLPALGIRGVFIWHTPSSVQDTVSLLRHMGRRPLVLPGHPRRPGLRPRGQRVAGVVRMAASGRRDTTRGD